MNMQVKGTVEKRGRFDILDVLSIGLAFWAVSDRLPFC